MPETKTNGSRPSVITQSTRFDWAVLVVVVGAAAWIIIGIQEAKTSLRFLSAKQVDIAGTVESLRARVEAIAQHTARVDAFEVRVRALESRVERIEESRK